jgi:hypothetical protein
MSFQLTRWHLVQTKSLLSLTHLADPHLARTLSASSLTSVPPRKTKLPARFTNNKNNHLPFSHFALPVAPPHLAPLAIFLAGRRERGVQPGAKEGSCMKSSKKVLSKEPNEICCLVGNCCQWAVRSQMLLGNCHLGLLKGQAKAVPDGWQIAVAKDERTIVFLLMLIEHVLKVGAAGKTAAPPALSLAGGTWAADCALLEWMLPQSGLQ